MFDTTNEKHLEEFRNEIKNGLSAAFDLVATLPIDKLRQLANSSKRLTSGFRGKHHEFTIQLLASSRKNNETKQENEI